MAIKFTQVVDLGGNRITGVGPPTGASDAVSKGYVDASSLGLDWKASVVAASTVDIDLAAPAAPVDGVTLAAGERFLAKDQTDPTENGIYVFVGAALPATRAVDADTSAKVSPGLVTSVELGTVNGDKSFLLITDGPITLDTTPLVFTVMTGGASSAYLAGVGLTLTGSTFAADPAVVVRKYATDVGNGALTTITVTHNLNSRDVRVSVYTNGAPWDDVYCEVGRTTVNTVDLLFGSAPAAAAYRAVVQG